MKNQFKTINFQLFAHGGEGEGGAPHGINIDGLEDKDTYTKEELVLFAQRYADSRVTSALEKVKKKSEPPQKKSFEQMSEEERRNAEFESMKEEIANLRKANILRDNKIALQAEMSKRNIPVELSEFLVSEDSDEMFENLKKIENTFKNIVNNEVTKRLNSSTPNSGNNISAEALTREKFKTMTLQEQNKVYEENPELYMKLAE